MTDGGRNLQTPAAPPPAHAERRPWGYFEVLADEQVFKCKKIVVSPGKRLSLQRHRHRDEHWYIVQGRARVTLDGRMVELAQGCSVDIPRAAFHRVENPENTELMFIEVQSGSYFGEDDIERSEDDFGRA